MKVRGGKPLGSFGKSTTSLLKLLVVKHFVSSGVSRRTVFSILERFESGETLERKSGSDWKPRELPQSKQQLAGETGVRQCRCVTALFGQKVGKFNISKSYVHHALKNSKAGVKNYKVPEGP